MSTVPGKQAEDAPVAGPASTVRWLGRSIAVIAPVTLAVAVTTPPRSGPNCRSGCIVAPYTGGVQYVPRDFWWMYPACLLAVLAVALVVAVPLRATPAAQLAGRIATVLTSVAAAVIVVDYGLQLSVVQPSLLRGETSGLGLISQYNPHGVFIALENVGYLFWAVGLGLLGASMRADTRARRACRAILLSGGLVAVVGLIVLAAAYRSDLDYRFEVLAIVIDWLVLLAAGVLLGLPFRRPIDGPAHR